MINKVEDTIREAIQTEGISRGNSANMSHIEEIVKNAITQAHGDTCRALDRIVEEAGGVAALPYRNSGMGREATAAAAAPATADHEHTRAVGATGMMRRRKSVAIQA
jgi:ferritin-like metal-binding protein YciE